MLWAWAQQQSLVVKGKPWPSNRVVSWWPGKETSLALPCSNLRSFGSKCTVLKKVLVKFLRHFLVLAVIWHPTVIQRPVNCALVTPLPPKSKVMPLPLRKKLMWWKATTRCCLISAAMAKLGEMLRIQVLYICWKIDEGLFGLMQGC